MPSERSRRRPRSPDRDAPRAYRCQQTAVAGQLGLDEPEIHVPSGAPRLRECPMPEDLFREMHETYAARMRRLALQITRNEADADDAVQDALMRVYEKYASFRHASSLWTWIYRITQTSALMILKKNRSIRRIADASREIVDCRPQINRGATPEHALIQSRLLDALQESIDRLIPSLGRPMRDYLCDGLSQQDLCDRHGLTLLAAKARLHRARVLMRGRLAPHLYPSSQIR
ncbi:MAG: sigma-70 family RNA polymerase sigma factor [Deltaproteobacteria bacterium]|nr:sigma-70 family RNA polymerase sigma factor [Deltaproteobacteria bacterium]